MTAIKQGEQTLATSAKGAQWSQSDRTVTDELPVVGCSNCSGPQRRSLQSLVSAWVVCAPPVGALPPTCHRLAMEVAAGSGR
jgi:hypothetical protein